MITLETLLGAVIGAGLSLAAEAGFGDQARSIKNRLTRESEAARQKAFDRAFESAAAAVGKDNLDALTAHEPFREALIVGLLDPIKGFDIQSAASVCGDAFPMRAPAIQDFFADLRSNIRKDPLLGPLMKEFQELYFRKEVMDALKETKQAIPTETLVSHFNARLDGSGAIAQGDGAIAAGENSVVVAGNVHDGFVVVHGDYHLHIHDKTDAEDLYQKYLVDLASATSRLSWVNVDPDHADPQKSESLELMDVYTALDTTELERMESEEKVRRYLFHQKDEMRISAQEVVNRKQKLVLLGDPGAGKSTFVNFLGHVLAQAGREKRTAEWIGRLQKAGPWDHDALMPVRVILKDFAAEIGIESIRHDSDLLLAYLRKRLEEKLPEFWNDFYERLSDPEQPCLILLDGLDEIPIGQRRTIIGIINDFAGKYGENRYLVTCRIYAYIGKEYQLPGFHQATLTPFNKEQIEHFIDAWYSELSARERFTENEAMNRAERLKTAATRSDLIGLAERPLLMTVMAILHTFRGQLPQDRVELYRWTVDLLFRRWESRIGGEEGLMEILNIPGLKPDSLLYGLYFAAYQAHSGASGKEDTADIPEETLRKNLAPYLGGSWDKAGIFMQYVRERAGLLIRHKPDAYTFPHRTFQEFMAACHIVETDDYPGKSAELILTDPDKWRIVFVLAAGNAARGQAIASVNALCPDGVSEAEEVSRAAYLRAVIAEEALLEIGLATIQQDASGKAVLKRIRTWLAEAVSADDLLDPRERVEAGNMLSELGDPRFNSENHYLPDDETLGFIKIEAGEFLMGSDKKADSEANDNELPQHTVHLSEYSIARFPVTVAQYRMFAEETGHEIDERWKKYNKYDNHPVVNVSWRDAVKYCEWLTEKLKEKGETVRLPTEAEWEKAARGEDGRIYPCGEEIEPDRANYKNIIGSTSPVGCFPEDVSSYESMDMTGNVWEWCLDGRRKYESETVNDPIGPTGGAARVIRGGAWGSPARGCRAAYRFRPDPGLRNNVLSFRCVRAPLGQQAGQGKG